MLKLREVGLKRRDILIGGPGLALGYLTASVLGQSERPETRRPFRIAHLTDIHIVPEKVAVVAQALEHAQSQGADLIINGGDAIMDASKTERKVVDIYWDVYHRTIRGNCSVPVLNVLGNHDIWGWATEDRFEDSKKEALERLGLERGYYSMERGGWKVIVLDSIHWSPDRPRGYTALFGLEQLGWLEKELEATKLPVMIVSHIPILSACAFFDGQNERSGNWTVPGEWMHLDARTLKRIFGKFPNVKLCLAGHIHLVDSLRYAEVEYFCNGAVCGYYWEGAYQEFGPGYAMVDLFPDGTYEHRMVYY